MSENTVYDYSGTCSKLKDVIQNLDVRIKMSEQNTKLRSTYSDKMKRLEQNIAYCNEVIEHVKKLLEDTNSYISKRRKASMQNINNALRLSGEIIQDATPGIFFQIEDNGDAWISTPDELEVDDVEGGGYRQISSTFIRSTVLSANSNVLHTLLLDEAFALVSPENSTTLSLYLNLMCQNMQVISIEQKPQVYSNLDHIKYTFESGEYATVTRSEVRRGELSEEVNSSESKTEGLV